MKQFPTLTTYAKIQGIYGSHSTLVLLSIPVVIWSLLSEHPAYNFVGFVTSDNLLDIRRSRDTSVSLPEVAHIQGDNSFTRQQNNPVKSKTYSPRLDQNHDEMINRQISITPPEWRVPSKTQVENEQATTYKGGKPEEERHRLQKRPRYSSPPPTNETRGKGFNSMYHDLPISDPQKHQAENTQKRLAMNVMAPKASTVALDGPEIGTLVVIVDRAKILSNTEMISKLEAYCAVRLGEETKKTENDYHGG